MDFQCAIPTPIINGNRVFISSFYWAPGASLLEIKGGDVKPIWENRDFRNHATSSVLWEGHLYGFSGSLEKPQRELQCMELQTGKVKWAAPSMGMGGLLVADGKLVILSENGELVVADASPNAFKPLARAQILGGQSWNMPVLADGLIYARNRQGQLVCVDPKGK